MSLSPEETTKLKAMFMYLAKKRHKESEGKCGFHLMELQPILDELTADGELVKRPTINADKYFLNLNKIKHETKAHAEEVGQ